MVRRLVVRAAKVVFAAADFVHGAWPGPRLLIYHQVGAALGREMEVPAETFRRQLDILQARGELVDLETALARRGDPDAARLHTLGFDDGYRDLFDVAFPVLRERGIPFTVYLTTAPVETGRPLAPGAEPLTWDQVREMLHSGLVTLGAHTHTHPDLRGLPDERIVEEIERSNELIASRLGIEPRHFAYPKGYWDPTAERIVRSRYTTAALGAGDPLDARSDPYRLTRIPIQRSDGLFFFRRKVARGMRWEERARRRVKGYRNP